MSAKPVFYEHSPMASMYPLVGVWRHEKLLCKPGLYRVVFAVELQWNAPHSDAVMDDYGNLVEVPA